MVHLEFFFIKHKIIYLVITCHYTELSLALANDIVLVDIKYIFINKLFIQKFLIYYA